jgi:hypothetical protein
MPRGNGTGPLGKGPMTGRGMGYCVLKTPEDGGPPYGFAGVDGRPVGARSGVEREIGLLRRLTGSLERQLDGVRGRIGALERKGR